MTSIVSNDLQKAREIVKRHGSHTGPGGVRHPESGMTATDENIARMVEEGIKLGRSLEHIDMMEMLAKIINGEKP